MKEIKSHHDSKIQINQLLKVEALVVLPQPTAN